MRFPGRSQKTGHKAYRSKPPARPLWIDTVVTAADAAGEVPNVTANRSTKKLARSIIIIVPCLSVIRMLSVVDRGLFTML
jgi:hypothetical protein